jgi:hypothetical protein
MVSSTASVVLVAALQVPIPTPLPTPTPAPVPTPVVSAPQPVAERIVTLGQRAVRLSLFDNRVAVVSVREQERQVFFRRLTLGETEYEVYRDALMRDAGAVVGRGRSPGLTVAAEGLIRVQSRPGSVIEVRYSVGAVLDLVTTRLVATLDDLERRVSETSPSHEELLSWEPAPGDEVELYDGTRATVSEVFENGIIFLAYEETAIIEVVTPEQRSQRIMQVVSGAE